MITPFSRLAATVAGLARYIIAPVDPIRPGKFRFVLVMHTSPGFAGKKLIPETIDKVGDLREYSNEIGLNLDIISDGNVSIENAEKLYKKGANIFVSGSSSLFMNSELPIKDIINKKRNVIGWNNSSY